MTHKPKVIIGDAPVRWQDVVAVARGAEVALSDSAWARIQTARDAILALAQSGTPYYGINTGLGALCSVILPPEDLQKLSRHTLMSHSCGIGAPLGREQVRAIMVCAVINYSHGCSGVSPTAVEGLLALLNADVCPLVPAYGSVGYLTHMAHISLALIGEGEVDYQGKRQTAAEVLPQIGLAPVVLGAKDGLCLINGTPAMTGLACLALADCAALADWADVIAAMSFEALNGQMDALDAAIIQRKRHPGVQDSAQILHAMLADSEQVARSQGMHLQDALSVRSIPQVHGACRDQWRHAAAQIDAELNSATDNPLVICENGAARVISQANPHGESVAMACDVLAIAVCEWSSISERRSFRLVTPQANHLPPFLTQGSGVKSGMMIAQYSASSLAADNRRLAMPAVVDNYLTSGLQEDHVSLGDSAALKLDSALGNAFHVLAIEYLLAAQAFEFLEAAVGKGTGEAWRYLRGRVAAYDEEHSLSLDIARTYTLLRNSDVRVDILDKVL